ncbi:MAG: adenylate/guanylate cyclase domain-containing protein [Nitratireductor sp.]|nr:adenylate/guanylate cyclase domain-containing protein [Nitratireductor sp.]
MKGVLGTWLKPANLLLVFLAMVLVAGAWTWRLGDPQFLTAVRNFTFDTYQRIKPREPLGQPIRIIDIDEDAIARYGQWPWPRARIAEMVDRLRNLGAAVVVFDMVFSEPDPSKPESLLSRLGQLDASERADAERVLATLPDGDGELAEAISLTPVVTGFFNQPLSRAGLPADKSGEAIIGNAPLDEILPAITSSVRNLPAIEEAAAGNGSITLSEQTDDLIRKVPMFLRGGDRNYPALSIEAIRVALGERGYVLKTTAAGTEISAGANAMVSFRIGQLEVPVTEDGSFLIYYARTQPDMALPARRLLEGEDDAIRPQIEGNIVFIGTSAIGLRDLRITALGESVPGVLMHAQIADQILSGEFLQRPDIALGMENGIMATASLLLVAVLPFAGVVWSAMLGLVVATAIAGGSWLAFSRYGLLIDPVYPLATAGLVYLCTTILLFAVTEREKRFVRRAFQRYLAPDLLKKLENNPEALKLGGEIRDMTLMFMDIRGFTPISEKLAPEELVAFLNKLLSPLSEAILAREGAIDKYIGDSIMAFWNAPLDVEDHARKSALAALDMLRIVGELNAQDRFGFHQPEPGLGDVMIGIGLNSGEGCVGNMGSANRFDYSVVGDTVNIAARIESSCKAIGWPLLMSEMTASRCEDFAMLEARAIALKGKSKPVRLFALVGGPELAQTENWKKLLVRHQACLDALSGDSSAKIETLVRDCLAIAPKGLPAALEEFYARLVESSVKPKLPGA